MDRTFTARQLLGFGWRAMCVALALYLLAVFANAWELRHGGVSIKTSPLAPRIPAPCLPYAAGRTFGTPAGRTVTDDLLLAPRVVRQPFAGLVDGASLAPACLGFAMLAGLHGAPGGANFSDEWLDDQGEVVVRVRVEYLKPGVAPLRENPRAVDDPRRREMPASNSTATRDPG